MMYHEIISAINEADEKAINSAIHNNYEQINNEYYDSFINDNAINVDVIKYLTGEYYIDKRLAEEKNKNIIKFIEKNYNNSDRLYSMFKSNLPYAKEIVSNYINHKPDYQRIMKIKKLIMLGKKEVIEILNPYYISVDNYKFITDEFNFIVKNYISNVIFATKINPEMMSYFRESLNQDEYFYKTIIGNAYKILRFHVVYNNVYTELSKFVEINDYEVIKDKFLSDDDFFFEICKFAFEYYELPIMLNERINSIIIKDSRFKSKLKELNPLIDIEIASDLIWNEKLKKKTK